MADTHMNLEGCVNCGIGKPPDKLIGGWCHNCLHAYWRGAIQGMVATVTVTAAVTAIGLVIARTLW